jgi:hypothetical protein
LPDIQEVGTAVGANHQWAGGPMALTPGAALSSLSPCGGGGGARLAWGVLALYLRPRPCPRDTSLLNKWQDKNKKRVVQRASFSDTPPNETFGPSKSGSETKKQQYQQQKGQK